MANATNVQILFIGLGIFNVLNSKVVQKMDFT